MDVKADRKNRGITKLRFPIRQLQEFLRDPYDWATYTQKDLEIFSGNEPAGIDAETSKEQNLALPRLAAKPGNSPSSATQTVFAQIPS